MINDGRSKPAKNYQTSINSLLNFYNKKRLFVSDFSSKEINMWIKSLSRTARAKQMYPTYVKAMFEAACDEFNDYERGIMRIKTNPFKNVEIPKANKSRERFIEVDVLQSIFKINGITEREKLALDISKLIFCLAGINTVDLYNLELSEFRNGKLCYNRTKEENVREDKAYFEITVPDVVLPILDKYKNTNKTKRGCGKLFCFSDMYAEPDNFSRAIRLGFKSISERENIPAISAYYFRHPWSNI